MNSHCEADELHSTSEYEIIHADIKIMWDQECSSNLLSDYQTFLISYVFTVSAWMIHVSESELNMRRQQWFNYDVRYHQKYDIFELASWEWKISLLSSCMNSLNRQTYESWLWL